MKLIQFLCLYEDHVFIVGSCKFIAGIDGVRVFAHSSVVEYTSFAVILSGFHGCDMSVLIVGEDFPYFEVSFRLCHMCKVMLLRGGVQGGMWLL